MDEENKDAGANLADDPKDKEGKKDEGMQEGEGSVDVSSVVKAIESGAISIKDFDAIIAAIEKAKSGSDVPEEPADEVAPAAAPGAEAMGDKVSAEEFAALKGRLAAVELRERNRDAKFTRREAVEGAMERLKGLACGALDDLRKRLGEFHQECGGNAKLFGAYVDSIARHAAPDSGEDGPPAGSEGRRKKLPPAAMAFSSLGVTAVDRAARFCDEHAQLRASGMRTSLDDYVRRSMAREGYELPQEGAA